MAMPSEKRVYRERCKMMARIQGGYLHVYEILDGDKIIGAKTIRGGTKALSKGGTKVRTETKTYTLGDQQFSTAKEFVAAYEANQ